MIEKLQVQDVQELIHRPVMCSQQYHENQPLEFYCEECKVPICHKCSVVSHNRHTMTDSEKVAQVQKMQIIDALEKVEAETVVYENEIRKQTELMDDDRNEILSREKKMTDLVEELIRDLGEYEKDMKTKFSEIYEAQQQHHATQLENFELVLTQLKSCVERGDSIVQRNISAEILQTNQAIIGRCEELLKAKKLEIYKPAHVHYTVEQKVKILDRIVVSDTDPSLSLAEVARLKDVRAQTETNFTIVTRNSDGEQCYQKDVIKVNILNPAGDQLETEIEDTEDGKYTVTYTPQCVGQHRVEIQVNGQPLTGSPWIVRVVPHQYQFAFQFGSKGEEQGKFDCPVGVAVNDKSRILAIADYNNSRTQIFSFEGNFLREIALKGKPISLAFTESGDLLVRVIYDKRIFLFAENGQFIRYIGGEHVKTLHFVFVSSDGRIITSDSNDKTIKVLTADGKKLLQSFKSLDRNETPLCVVYHQAKFFASFNFVGRLVVFNNAGEYLHDIGSKGSGDGQFSGPTGLVIDKLNRLIVCDAGNSRLQLLTLEGKYIAQIPGRFFKGGYPHSAVISNTGNLFVTDSWGHCVHVFH